MAEWIGATGPFWINLELEGKGGNFAVAVVAGHAT